VPLELNVPLKVIAAEAKTGTSIDTIIIAIKNPDVFLSIVLFNNRLPLLSFIFLFLYLGSKLGLFMSRVTSFRRDCHLPLP
jgi:hypothetical protein